jgi:hypothetical protein
MQLTVPDKHALSSLDVRCRAEIERWRTLLQQVAQERGSGTPLTVALQHVARTGGVAFGTLKTKWFAFDKRGVAALVNRAKFPGTRTGLPALFKQHVRAMHELHQRNNTGRNVFRMIVDQWRGWRAGDSTKAIPGYTTPPEPLPETGLPRGWSEGNLSRRKNGKPSRYELDLRRKGTASAKAHLPTIIRTRVGLEFGQAIQIDDQDYDVWVNLEGINKKAMRPAGFNAFECLSGSHFATCFKPVIFDPQSSTKERLTEEDCVWFVISWLTTHGYRADCGTTIMAEKGTAAIKAALAAGLALVTNNKVQVATGGMTGKPLMKDMGFPVTSSTHGERMMAGQSRGNFKFKSDIEGSFALVRTLMSHLRGPTGTRLHAPEEDYALQIYNTSLLKWAEKLPEARAQLLMKPVMSWAEFSEITHWIYGQMDQRDWHQLEGWEQLGFMEQYYRPDPSQPDLTVPMSEIMAMPDPVTREGLLALMAMPNRGGLRRLSPRQVFTQHRHLLTRLDRHTWNLAIPNEYACETTVRDNHTIVVKNRAPGGRDFTYMSRCTTPRGFSVNVPAGEKVRVYANPFCPEEALVCDARDAAIGLATLMLPTCKLDKEGALRSFASVQQMRAEMDVETKARAAATMGAQRAYMVERNRAVIDGEVITDDERDGADASRAMLDRPHAPCAEPAPAPAPALTESASTDPMDW